MWKQFWQTFKTGIVTRDINFTTAQGDMAGLVRELEEKIKRVLGGSAHIRHVDTGSCNACDWEMTALLNPVYDLQRFGFDFVASPRHADILLVTGTPTKHLATALRKTYEATPEPNVVIALGDCACGCGVYKDSYAVYNGVSSIVPVDAYIPGCPPTPEDIIKGLLKALDRLPK